MFIHFAPFAELAAVAPYDQAAVAAGIGQVKTNYGVFQRKTPMGYGIMDLRPVLDTLSGKTAIIMLSDGKQNQGIDPVEQAKAIYASYPNVCFHIISFADNAYGKSVLDAIAALSNCSCPLVDGTLMLENGTTIDRLHQVCCLRPRACLRSRNDPFPHHSFRFQQVQHLVTT